MREEETVSFCCYLPLAKVVANMTTRGTDCLHQRSSWYVMRRVLEAMVQIVLTVDVTLLCTYSNENAMRKEVVTRLAGRASC